jgi:serine/threonine-protein kinase
MFLNRYVLLEPIGQGSVTVVYQAEDTLNNLQVAVKLLEPSLADNRRAQERLRRPAEIMSLLSDAGVPRVYEAGTAPLGDGSALGYCVMELLTGEALDSRLARGPLPWLQAIRVAATIADVLTLAHAQSIALRVLGPTGVLLTADGAKIVDFDAAMVVVPPPPAPAPPTGSGGSRRRRSAAPAPRPDRGAVAIATLAAEDVYALGCLLDQMIGGTGPGAGLPAPLVELLLRCLSEPAHRPDAATLSMELWGMLTPGMPPPSSSFEGGPPSVPMSLNTAPGRHSAAVAALESPSSVESHVVEAYISESYPADSYGTDSYASESFAADSFASGSHGTSSYAGEAYAASPYESESYGADAYVAESYAAESYVTESYASDASESHGSAESAAQARGALARAALDRSRHDHPVEQIAYRSTVDAATVGASLLDASSPIGPALLGGRTSARGGRAGLAAASGVRSQGTSDGRASRVRGAGGSAVAAALNGRSAAVATGAAGTVDDTHGDFAGAGYSSSAESDDARHGAFAGSDTIAGNGTGAVGSAPDSRIPVSHDRERAAGPQQVPVGHSGQGGRHRRRRPAWTAPTGQANALS